MAFEAMSPERAALRDKALELVRGGKSIQDTARGLGLPYATLHHWVHRANIKISKSEGKKQNKSNPDSVQLNELTARITHIEDNQKHFSELLEQIIAWVDLSVLPVTKTSNNNHNHLEEANIAQIEAMFEEVPNEEPDPSKTLKKTKEVKRKGQTPIIWILAAGVLLVVTALLTYAFYFGGFRTTKIVKTIATTAAHTAIPAPTGGVK